MASRSVTVGVRPGRAGVLRRWLVRVGDEVEGGETALAEYDYTVTLRRRSHAGSSPERGSARKVLLLTKPGVWVTPTGVSGRVAALLVREGDALQEGREAARLTLPCDHCMALRSVCKLCGADLAAVDYGATTLPETRIPLSYHSAEETVNEGVMWQQRRYHTRHLLRRRHLALVVDVDLTVLHATAEPALLQCTRASATRARTWRRRATCTASTSTAPRTSSSSGG